jgi:gamma-glutamyltranspeptidase/glutathione hydrolase
MSLRSVQHIDREEVAAPNAVVATQHPAEAEAGIAILKAGGNAIDAAVAIGFLATVVEPNNVVAGGCGFLLFHDNAKGEQWSIDFAPKAPKAARPDMFEIDDAPPSAGSLSPVVVKGEANVSGHLAAGVPGLVKALCTAHERWGKLPLQQVMEPAIHWAENGYACTWSKAWGIAMDQRWFERFPETGKAFLPGGYIPDQYTGAKIVQRDLAGTYRKIARDGWKAFYTGEIAHAIDEDMRKNGGILTAEDLAEYDVDVYKPVVVNYRGYDVHIPRAPSGAWTIAQTLNILENFDLGAMGHNSAQHLHTFIEAARHAFADRYYYIGDPDFVPSPFKGLLSKEYARELAKQVEPGRAKLEATTTDEPWVTYRYDSIHDPWPYDGGQRPSEPWSNRTPVGSRSHTTHFSVIDKDRNMVSVTETAAENYGAKFTTPGTGILHADAMVWFNPVPGAANSIAPNKHPMCNMGTMIVTRGGKPFMALGSPGGRKIMNCNTNVFSNVVDFGMTMQPAISAPRDATAGRITFSDGRLGQRTAERLAAMGHALEATSEENNANGWDYAHPAGVLVGDDGLLRGGVDAIRTAESRGY